MPTRVARLSSPEECHLSVPASPNVLYFASHRSISPSLFFLSASLLHSCALTSLVGMWILLSQDQQERARSHLHPVLALKVTVSFSSFDHNQKTFFGCMRKKSSHLGRTSHLATDVDAAKSFSVTQCCHLLGKLGLCTVTSASAKPMMIKNVVITIGQLLSVLKRGDIALGQHQPKQQKKCFPHSHSIVSGTQILHLSWNTNSGCQ